LVKEVHFSNFKFSWCSPGDLFLIVHPFVGGWSGLPIVTLTVVVTFRGENFPLSYYGTTLKIEAASTSEKSASDGWILDEEEW